MSKYKQIETQITEHDHITAALDEMGIPYEVGENLALYGYEGRKRKETANVVVRKAYVGDSANDLGWCYDEETSTYRCVISEFDNTGRDDDYSRATPIMEGVAQRAALLKLQELAFANGFALDVIEDSQNVQRVLIGGLS